MTAVSCGTKTDSNVNGGGTSDDDGDKKTLSDLFKVTDLGILTVKYEYNGDAIKNTPSRESSIVKGFIGANKLDSDDRNSRHLMELLIHADEEGQTRPRDLYDDELDNLPISVDGNKNGTFKLSLLDEVSGNFGGESKITIIPSDIEVSFALKFDPGSN